MDAERFKAEFYAGRAKAKFTSSDFASEEAANGCQSAQIDLWCALLEQIREQIQDEPSTSDYASALASLRRTLSDGANILFPLETVESGGDQLWRITGEVPLLNRKIDVSPDNIWLAIGIILFWIVPKLKRTSAFRAVLDSKLPYDPRAQRGIIEAITPSERTLAGLFEIARGSENRIESTNTLVRNKLNEIDVAIAKAREDAIFKGASALWRDKAIRHTMGFTLGFAAILSTLIAMGVLIVRNAGAIRDWLPQNKATGEYSYLSVMIVALTFLALAWVYRMVGRFVVDNMAYAADARQRQMTLQTFLTLVGTPEAGMQAGERVLILNAIFRPTPGQGQDDPAPSSLMDLIKDTLPKK